MKTKSSWLLLLALLGLASAAQSAERLQILDPALAPIAGAEVTIGAKVATTDANGFVVAPADWKAALPVTVKASGFVVTRFENVPPKSVALQIHQLDPAALVEINGETTSFQNIKRDGLVDFALVFPTMSRRQLMQFSVTDLISPETDTIRVATQKIDLPSNVTLPEQKETYILPITLKKPNFRAYVKPDSQYTVTAAHGQFPLKSVISEIQNGASFLDVMNYFTFIDFGQLDVTVQKNTVPGQMIPVNQNLIDGQVAYQAPAFNADQVLLVAPLVEQNGTFYPTDLKRVESSEARDLTVPSLAKNVYVVSVLTPKAQAAAFNAQMTDMLFAETQPVAYMFQRLTRDLYSLMGLQEVAPPTTMAGITLSITKTPMTAATEFIGLTQPPAVTGTRLQLTVPTAPASVNPVATYVILSEVEKIEKGQYTIEKRIRHFEFFAQSWIDGLEIPDLTNIIVPGKKYRWEVMYLGRDKNTKAGSYFLDEITHVSRHSYDF